MRPVTYGNEWMPDHSKTIAVITGGTQGLGLAIAEALIADGCRQVIISGRAVTKGEAAAARLRETGADVRFLPADLGKVDEAVRLIDRALARFGRVTSLVNAAASTARGSILDTTPEGWDDLMNTNARGPFFALQRFAQAAVAAGHPATAVNIVTMSSHCGQSFLAGYAASKAALANITKNSANALRSQRIRVNGINVGWMDTPGEDTIQREFHGAPADWLEQAEAKQPFGMLVKPGHVAGLASYMLSDASGVMTGAMVDFDQNVTGAYGE
jgi:NAD(P)-dependent dehydrogenase (short-subunit alcohol dehydrogenase family)